MTYKFRRMLSPFLLQSISFHEGGKRHKANVAKRISELGKQSFKDEKAKQKVDQQIRQMEDAAMRAYGEELLDYNKKEY